jgi:uncharacterized protein
MNKKILALLLCIILPASVYLFAQKFPKPIGYVNDFAGVIDPGSKAQIEKISTVLKEKTGVEVAVVSVETIDPYASIEEYSIDMATEWGIGRKGEDTGILLLLTMRERRVRLEIGYGLEGIIPDGLAGEIIDKSILPSLRAADYGTGLLKGVQAVTGIIAREYDVDIDSSSISESRKYTRRVNPALIRIITILIFLFLFGGGRFFIWPLLFMGGASRRGFYGGGFGSSGSSFGGGFSGFSGGGFGGGGASRGF